MEHIKDFTGFAANEANDRWFEKEWIDRDLAEITINALADSGRLFSQTVYMSMEMRNNIKNSWGKRLPRGFAGSQSRMMASSIIGPLVDDVVYQDGSNLVKGEETIMHLKPETTWAEVRELIIDRFGPISKKGRRSVGAFGRF